MDMSRLELFLNGHISMNELNIPSSNIAKVKRDLFENFKHKSDKINCQKRHNHHFLN